jgi:hypothetical protein
MKKPRTRLSFISAHPDGSLSSYSFGGPAITTLTAISQPLARPRTHLQVIQFRRLCNKLAGSVDDGANISPARSESSSVSSVVSKSTRPA